MARRTGKAQPTETPATEADSTTTDTNVQEDIVSTDTNTQPEADESVVGGPVPTEDETPTTDAKPEAEFDLSDFEAAAEAAVAEADTTTGDVPEAEVSKVNAEYRKVAGLKGKNAARSFLNAKMKGAMDESDIVSARAWMNLGENLSAGSSGGGSSSTPRQPVDPTDAYVDRLVTLKLAVNLVPEPEGLAEDWSDKANAKFAEVEAGAKEMLAWLQSDAEDKGDEPEVSATAKAAAKLAIGRSAKAGSAVRASGTSTFTGERRNILTHIAEAFAEQESGAFLKISEIRGFKSSEYGDDHPSAGAISARLFPKNGKVSEAVATTAGVKPDEVDGSKGARKL